MIKAGEICNLPSRDQAAVILDKAETGKVAVDLRARVFELGEARFPSIRMQLSVSKDQATEISRGVILALDGCALEQTVKTESAIH